MSNKYLGDFTSIGAVWSKYPEGGMPNNYLTVNGVRYNWSTQLNSWVTPNQMQERGWGADNVNGDLYIENDLRVGGTVYANKIRHPYKGLFGSLEQLQRYYPNPKPGDFADVGYTSPSTRYACEVKHEWTDTGQEGVDPSIVIADYANPLLISRLAMVDAPIKIDDGEFLLSWSNCKVHFGKCESVSVNAGSVSIATMLGPSHDIGYIVFDNSSKTFNYYQHGLLPENKDELLLISILKNNGNNVVFSTTTIVDDVEDPITLVDVLSKYIGKPSDEPNKSGTIYSRIKSIQNSIDKIIKNRVFKGIATPETDPGNPDENVFYIADVGTYPNFGDKKITGLSILINSSEAWSVIRIMPVNNSGVKAIINNANTFIQIDTQNKTIIIPESTRCVALEGTVYTFNAKTYNLPQSSGNVGFTNIFFNKDTKELEFQSISNPEFDVNLWRGNEYFWIGCIEIMNTINNIVYLLSPKYVVDGKYYGYFFTKEKEICNSGVNRIITNKNTYISFNSSDNTITIPSGARFVTNDKQLVRITNGTFNLPNDDTAYVAFTNIFVRKSDGEIQFQNYNSWDESYWNDEYCYIGSYQNTSTVNLVAYLLADTYKVDGQFVGRRPNASNKISNSGVNRIINTPNSYIQIKTDTQQIVVPYNSRVVDYNKTVYVISEGTFDLPIDSLGKVPYTNIFVKKADGTLHFQTVNVSWDISLWEDDYFYIGSVELNQTTADNIAYILADVYKVDDEFVGLRAKKQVTQAVIPQIYNNPIRRRGNTEPLKICCFGSSWFMDTWWYLNKILQSAGINAELTCFYTGGAYFSQWIDRYNNNQSVDCWKSTNGEDWNKTTALFKDTLDEGWDIIGFQQGAFQSIKWETEWLPFIEQIVSIVKRSCGIDTVIAFNSTWTPAVTGNLAPFENTENGQKEWQQLNYDNVKKFISLSGIDNVSPNGATMWAMRKNPELNISSDMASDTLHPDNGLPIYALAGTFFETFIAPMYGISFDSVDWLPDESTQKAPVSGNSWQSISSEQRDLIRKIIKLSFSNRFGFETL